MEKIIILQASNHLLFQGDNSRVSDLKIASLKTVCCIRLSIASCLPRVSHRVQVSKSLLLPKLQLWAPVDLCIWICMLNLENRSVVIRGWIQTEIPTNGRWSVISVYPLSCRDPPFALHAIPEGPQFPRRSHLERPMGYRRGTDTQKSFLLLMEVPFISEKCSLDPMQGA